jgi:ribosomal protein S9
MPARSKVTCLPEPIRAELDKRLITTGFSDYSSLEAWLQEQGFEISRSAIHRYGQEFEEKIMAIKVATEQAKAIAEAAGDEEGAMNEALIRLIQQKSFDVLVGLEGGADLPKMGTMVARISRASVQQKKWMTEVRQKTRSTADEVAKEVKKGGLSAEKAEEIRKKILGIV